MDNSLIQHHISSSIESRASRQAKPAAGQKELKEACEGFEAIFIHTVLKSMRQTLSSEDTLLDSGHAYDTYLSMHDQYLSEQLSKGKNSLGIKEFLFEQLNDHK